MSWVAWRQHRQQMLAGMGLVGLIAAFLLTTGAQMSHSFHSTGLAACLKLADGNCGGLADAFMTRFASEQLFAILLIAVPVLAGMFWGAPLIARESERGTYRFAWTQGIGRRRWLSWKVGFVGAATAIAGGALALLMSWWVSPLLTTQGSRSGSGAAGFEPGLFDLHGIVPLGYALFAFALGLALGHVIGKVLPAMGATLVAFAAVRASIEAFARPHYMAPKIADLRFFGTDVHGWVIKGYGHDKFGHIFPQNGIDPAAVNYLRTRCPGFHMPGPGELPVKRAMDTCFNTIGLRTTEIYQPASRLWTFQWIEFGVFVGLAAILVGFVIWRIKRTVT